jgi:uncharacterized protein (DUF1778 family)
MASERKRARGAGRKPKGEFVGKSATLTTRIRPDTRDALEKAARASKRSLSQEVEFRLRTGLEKSRETQRRNQALSYVVTLIAERIEASTGRSWLDDPFTGVALRYAIDAFVCRFGPAKDDASVEVPPKISEQAEKMPPMFAKEFRTPAGCSYIICN